MSGTSMDGIDAALIETDGHAQIRELANISLAYDSEFKTLLKAAEHAVRHHVGDLARAKTYYPAAIQHYLNHELSQPAEAAQALALYFHHDATAMITFDQVVQRSTELHAKIVKQLLEKAQKTADNIDVIGYHGQTLFHRPANKITWQVGNGAWLAKATGITVVNNFRSRDVAAGGQGAPFAPLYHQALAIRDNKIPAAIVNCGGIANVTIITGKNPRDVIGFDTGPANGLIDRYVKQRTHGKEHMDENGHYGKAGKVHENILALLYEKSVVLDGKNFFTLQPPKSLDIGDLHLIPELDALTLPDACATLEAFTADTIVNSLRFFPEQPPRSWILAGGGWHNPVIYRELETRLKKALGNDISIMTADQAGWNSQALEAQIFAYLAVRSLQKLPISLPNITRVPEPLTGGEIHKN